MFGNFEECMPPKDEYRLAHKYCVANEDDIRNSEKCGCFFCLAIFDSKEITDWLREKNGRTALCPYCGIDAVIPDSKLQFDEPFLKGMHDLWFK